MAGVVGARAGRSRGDEFADREPSPDDGFVLSSDGAAPQDCYRSRSISFGPLCSRIADFAFMDSMPAKSLIELKPRPSEVTIRQEDIEALLEREGSSIALIMLGGVNYATGPAVRHGGDYARRTRAGMRRGLRSRARRGKCSRPAARLGRRLRGLVYLQVSERRAGLRRRMLRSRAARA